MENREKNIKFSTENYEIIFNESQLITWITKLKKTHMIVFGIETNKSNDIFSDLIGLSFAIAPGMAVYIPVPTSCWNVMYQISCDRILKLLKPVLEDNSILKIGQNLKFDRAVLRNYDIKLRGIAIDIMLESYILDNLAKDHSINALSLRFLKHKIINLKAKSSFYKKQLPTNRIELEKAGNNAAKNVDIMIHLHLKMWPKIQRQKGLLNVFENIEMPLIPILSKLERTGVKIDPAILQQYSEEIALKLTNLEQKAYKIVGETFNILSIKQIQTILFQKKIIKPLQKTRSSLLSTSGIVLKKLALKHPLPEIILEYRKLSKLKLSYADKLPLMINQKTGRVHTSYHQEITTTGRLSSSYPNLQNIPVRNIEGRRIRQAFVAPENYVLISADYSQIELRIIAHLSHDKNLLMAFDTNQDIHRATAAQLFNLSIDDVTNEQRYHAKEINFGLIYGMSAFGLSQKLNISRQESQKYIDLYFKKYPRIQKYMAHIRTKAKEKGYVETIDGRRLYIRDINSNNAMRRAYAERAAINAPIQGTAADIVKKAMIEIDGWLEKNRPMCKMIMQVHDELVFEVHKDDLKVVSETIHKLMKNCMVLDVPLSIKIGSGKNWDQAH